MEQWRVKPKDGETYVLEMTDGRRIRATWKWIENDGRSFVDADGSTVPNEDIASWGDPPADERPASDAQFEE